MPDDLDLLTPENSRHIIIDHQPQMAFGVPTTITTVETESFEGHTYPEILAVLPDNPILERTSMNSWNDQTSPRPRSAPTCSPTTSSP